MFRKNELTGTLTGCAMLAAMEIVLTRFCSLNTWNIRIGFGFAALAAAGILYGPLAAGIVGAAADILGALLFPTGPFFPGFTVTAFLSGITYGLFLHGKQDFAHIIPAVLIRQLLLSFLLNTFFISFLYGSPFKAVLATRAVQTAVMIPVEIAVIRVMAQLIRRFRLTSLQTGS